MSTEALVERALGAIIGLAIALAFGGFGLFCVWVGLRGLVGDLRAWRQALASRHWPATTATIVTSQVLVERVGRRVTYTPTVTYRYDTGGQARTGTRLGFSSWGHQVWRNQAEAALRPYPPGATTPVYVDPVRVDVATLERRLPRGQFGGCLLTMVLVGVGVGFVAIAWIGLMDVARSANVLSWWLGTTMPLADGP